jgi:hypothetical protein
MAKQTFTTGQVLTAAQMTSLQQTAMGGGSATAKTTNYVLVAADAGTVVAMNAAGSTTITVNTGLFSAGDSVFIQNWGAGTTTVTAGTATVTTHGSLALGQYEGGQLYFTSSSAAIFFDISQSAGMVNPMTTTGDTIYSSSGSTPARLGIGSTGNVLTVAGGVPTWSAPASGGGMTSLASGSLSGSSVNLSSISSSYNNLQLVIRNFKPATNGEALRFRLNGDTSASTWANSSNNTDSAKAFSQDQMTSVGNASSVTANGFVVVNFYDYANAVTWKTMDGIYMWNYTSDATQLNWQRTTSFYNNTAAISSIQLFPSSGNFTSGNYILYGVK